MILLCERCLSWYCKRVRSDRNVCRTCWLFLSMPAKKILSVCTVLLLPYLLCSSVDCLLKILKDCLQNVHNPLDSKDNYSAESNNMKLVHWPLMGRLLHLVRRGGASAGCGPTQSPPHCTKCNSPPINGQSTNHCIALWWSVARQF